MKIAFRVYDDRVFASVIQWWDKTTASHVELILREDPVKGCLCASSSMMDGGVRKKWIRLSEKPVSWAIYDISTSFDREAVEWFEEHAHAKYDYMGLIAQVFRPMRDTAKKFWCGESVAAALGLADPWRYTPGALYALARSIGTKIQ